MNIGDQIFVGTIFLLGLAMAPVMLIWGWIRWSRKPRQRDLLSVASLISLLLASSSAALAMGGLIYGQAIGGFPYYDPRLLRIIRVGALIAAGGFLIGIAGAWRRNPLRWHGVLSALGMLAFWLCVAEGE
jgi:hypothetical protein